MGTSDAKIYGYYILVGLGQMSFQAAYSIVPSKVRPNEMTNAIQFLNIGQQRNILIAFATCKTVFQNVALQNLLAILGPSGFLKEDVPAAIAGVRSIVLQSAPST